MSRSVILVSGDGGGAQVDALAGALAVIDVSHRKVHEGVNFASFLYNAALGAAASLDLLIQVGALLYPHLIISAGAGGDADVFLYEGTTFSAAGAGVTAVNRDRSSATVATATITSGPTITLVGTALFQHLLPGGSHPVNAPGGSGETREEFILDVSTDYMVRLTNITGGAQAASVTIGWYEAA